MEPHEHGSRVDSDAFVASKSPAKLPEDRRILMYEIADLKRRLCIKEGECDSLMFQVNDNLMFQARAEKYTGLYDQLYSEHKQCDSRRQKWRKKKVATLDKLDKVKKKKEDLLVRSRTAEEDNLKLVREQEMAAAAHEVERRNLEQEIAELRSRLESEGQQCARQYAELQGAAGDRQHRLERENEGLHDRIMKLEAGCQALDEHLRLAQEKSQSLEETNGQLTSERETTLKENQALQKHIRLAQEGNKGLHDRIMKLEADCQALDEHLRLAQEKSQSLEETNGQLTSERETILKENQALQKDMRLAQEEKERQIGDQQRQIATLTCRLQRENEDSVTRLLFESNASKYGGHGNGKQHAVKLQEVEKENKELRKQAADNKTLVQETLNRSQSIEALNRQLSNEKENTERRNVSLEKQIAELQGAAGDRHHRLKRENEGLHDRNMKLEADCQALNELMKLAQEKSQSLEETNGQLTSERETILKENQALRKDMRLAQEEKERQIGDQQRQIAALTCRLQRENEDSVTRLLFESNASKYGGHGNGKQHGGSMTRTMPSNSSSGKNMKACD